ncbi:MAG TPA: ion transporter, partial [Woeseiaceae bacterium]|nr:ion transporter [Woeseiaceae bacterium]
MSRFSTACRRVYYGHSPAAIRAQYLFIALDVAVISYFVVTTFLEPYNWIAAVDMVIGVLFTIDFACRLAAERDRGAFLVKPMTIIDLIVIASLFMPALIGNFAFLRLVRSLRLLRSYALARELRKHSRFFTKNEDVIFSALNLLVFIFVVTATVYQLQVPVNDSINN